MSPLALEDFAAGTAEVRASPAADVATRADDRYDEGYNAGWEDAVARLTAEHGRIGEELGARLTTMGLDRQAAIASVLESLGPALRDIFDRLLPASAQRALLPIVMQDLRRILADTPGPAEVFVAPEEAAALSALVERSGIGSDRARVLPEAALSLGQAQIRWPGGERRIDLEAALTALDDALEAFLATTRPAEGAVAQQPKGA
ncbi:hypothetical protein MWU52_11835 [Jannaschia sp. S6380]|uniref:hypothetical protein n=1 Tax=Jannaschia sp. S6380 TaxID=2926408 RepID=UPI001FF52FD5|nr:hypothetical protein [Jannaschia sp. S6380]MCK0168246.1 hypothetical protein [Jannaschia sp. S6380]